MPTSVTDARTCSSYIVPLEFLDLHLISDVTKPDAFPPTSVHKVEVVDCLVRKCGDFSDIYSGEVSTQAPYDTVPKRVAIKRFRDHCIRQGILSILADPEDMWLLLKHPNICPIWVLTSSTELIPAIAMPWFANGNVVDFICKNNTINKLDIVKQVANAVAYIHSMGGVHGNILPSNIMITDHGRPCISDVGLNARLSRIKYSGAWPIPSGCMFKAPEELSPQVDSSTFLITKEMDVYAFASTVYTIFTSKPPFPSKPYGRAMRIKACGRVPKKPVEISGPLWNLLKRCWSYNPEDRRSMAEIEIELAAI